MKLIFRAKEINPGDVLGNFNAAEAVFVIEHGRYSSAKDYDKGKDIAFNISTLSATS